MTGGRPYLWKIAALIEERGGEDWFFGQIADDVPLIELAEGLGCSRYTLYTWIDETPERQALFKKARTKQAHSIVEDEARAARKQPPRSPVEAQAQGTNLKRVQWRASKLNREDYGEEKNPQLVVNVGSLHAGALRARVTTPALPAPQIVEAQVEDE